MADSDGSPALDRAPRRRGGAPLEQRWAIATAGLTYLLLLAGGLVHSTGSSLACPDWPTCYGSLTPRMVGGVLFEHGHRLLAAAVATATVVLALLLRLRRRRDGRLALLGAAAVAMVLAQALLGGLTVLLKLPPLVSTAHLALSVLFFASILTLAHRSGRRAVARPGLPRRPRRAIAWALGAVYAQVVLGAAVRHAGVALVCVDLPWCRGELWPDGAYWTVYLQVLHRAGALVTLVLVARMALLVVRAAPARPGLRALALAAPALVAAQIALGVLAILRFLDLPVVMGHLGVAAALVGTLVALALAAAPRPAALAAPAVATAPRPAEPPADVARVGA